MSNPPNGYNTDVSYNKFKGSYFNDDIDVSGGDIISRSGNLYLAPNSSIYTSANQIQFNEEFQFTDFIDNVNVLGQLKNTYNSVSYDVGLQCEKTDTLVSDVATLSPIVSDTAFKCSGFYWDSGLSSTVFNNNASFPNASISSTAINNTSFVALSGAQTIDGIKTFNSAPVMSGASITNLSIPVGKITGTAVALSGTQTITATKTFSVVQNFTNNLRLDGSLLVGTAGATTITNAQLQLIPNISTLNTKTTNQTYSSLTNQTAFSNLLEFTGTLNGFSVVNFNNAITQSLGLTSPAQTQLTTNANNITTANSNITTLTNKLTNVSFTTPTTFITGTTEANVLKFTTSLNGMTTTIFTYLTTVSSDVQSQINTLTTNSVSISANNIFTGLCQFSNNLQLNSALVIKTPSTSITLSNDNLTRIQYLSTVSSDIQTQTTTNASNITTLTTKLTGISYASSITTIANTLASSIFTFSTSINGTTKSVFDNILLYCNSLSGNVQTALTNLSYSVNPVGTIIMSPLSDIQTSSSNKYLLCDGQSVGRSSYPNLFAKIGTSFGSIDPFNFNVPNYQGAFLRGYGQAMVNGQIYEGNFTVNTPQQDAIQEHTHWGQTGSYCGSNRVSIPSTGFANGLFYPQTYNFDQTGLQSTGRSDSGETRPMNYSVFYYIKS